MNTRCAACKKLRRKCMKDCVLAPYFPPHNPQRFEYVHEIFGASNTTKMLEQLPVILRGEAAECICFEAKSRVKDPVYGCVGFISNLQDQVTRLENELLSIEGELAVYKNVHQNQEMVAQKIQQDPSASTARVNGHDDPFLFDLDHRFFTDHR